MNIGYRKTEKFDIGTPLHSITSLLNAMEVFPPSIAKSSQVDVPVSHDILNGFQIIIS